MKNDQRPSGKPIPVRLGETLLSRVKEASGKMERGDQEVMRLAMEIGLEDLRRINYNIAGAVVDASTNAKSGKLVRAPVHEQNPEQPGHGGSSNKASSG